MATKKPKHEPGTPPTLPTLPPVADPIQVDTRTELQLEVAYRWHRGEEAIAVQVYRDAHPEGERPDIDDALVACGNIAAKGPPPDGYQPPGADLGTTPIEGVVHPPDAAYLPTEHEPLPEVTTVHPSRYAVLGTDSVDHEFSLTEAERLAVFVRGTDQNHLVARLVDEHAATRLALKKEMIAAEAERDRLLDCAKKGVEVRSVKVTRVADYVTGIVEYRLPDGSVLKTAPLKDDDKQLQMFRLHDRATTTAGDLLRDLPDGDPDHATGPGTDGASDGPPPDDDPEGEEF